MCFGVLEDVDGGLRASSHIATPLINPRRFDVDAVANAMHAVRWRIEPGAEVEADDIRKRWESLEDRTVSITRKRKTRTFELDPLVLDFGVEDGALYLDLLHQQGARTRQVLTAVVGVDPMAEVGWRATKTEVLFKPAAPEAAPAS